MSSPPPRHRLVLFDVGNVLACLRPWEDAVPELARPTTGPLDRVVRELHASEVLARFERGRASAEEFYAEVRRHFGVPLADEVIHELYLRRVGPPMEGMADLVRDARDAGYRVAGLSDTNPIHLEAIRGLAAVRLLERLVTSCEIGCTKPSRQAFSSALELLGAQASTTLFVDDLDPNVAGARAAGLDAVRFEDAATLRDILGL